MYLQKIQNATKNVILTLEGEPLPFVYDATYNALQYIGTLYNVEIETSPVPNDPKAYGLTLHYGDIIPRPLLEWFLHDKNTEIYPFTPEKNIFSHAQAQVIALFGAITAYLPDNLRPVFEPIKA